MSFENPRLDCSLAAFHSVLSKQLDECGTDYLHIRDNCECVIIKYISLSDDSVIELDEITFRSLQAPKYASFEGGLSVGQRMLIF